MTTPACDVTKIVTSEIENDPIADSRLYEDLFRINEAASHNLRLIVVS